MLKLSISAILKMEEWEYNYWLGYMMLEIEEQELSMNKTRMR